MPKPILSVKSECTGCEACKNSCPQNCITMERDGEGFLRPMIDYDRCVGCLICQSSCPVVTDLKNENSIKPSVFACWHNDDEIRMKSSSGGAFSALAEVIIEQGGVVFGAAYDDKLHVRHCYIERKDEIEKLRRSKYVQSEIGDSYRQVKQFLEKGRKVLFVGTPCQVAGLQAFMGKRIYENLVTVDFVCHGVPSPVVFEKYISAVQKKYQKTIVDFNFRDKRNGWQNNSVTAKISEGIEIRIKGRHNSYLRGFYISTFLRSSCYKCAYLGVPRQGDVTIADFWGISNDDQVSQDQIDKGISLLMINCKGMKPSLFESLNGKMTIIERSFDEAKSGNKPMFEASLMPQNRGDFFRDLERLRYDKLAHKYMRYPFKRRMIELMKEKLGLGVLTELRKLKTMIGI